MFDRASWLRQDYKARKRALIEYLGGKCRLCGSVEQLEPDHIDASSKCFDISANLNRRWETIKAEVDKCQLLCHPCHVAKSSGAGDFGGGHNRRSEPPDHGTASRYTHHGCRCDPCREAAALAKGRTAPTKRYKKAEHGSASMYGYHKCRCDLCKEAHRLRFKQYRQTRLAQSGSERDATNVEAGGSSPSVGTNR